MRNRLIIAGCAALVFIALLLILFGGEILEPRTDEPRAVEPGAPPPDRDAGVLPTNETEEPVSTDVSGAENSEMSPPSDLAAQLADGARQINAGGPIRLDEMTMMTSASSAGNRITYRLEFSRRLTPREAASLRELAASSNRSTLCAREVTREWIAMGAEVEYEYFDPTGQRLFSTPVTGC